MAQTTNAISMKDAYVAVGTNGTVWTDVSGMTNEVTISGGERATGSAPTFEGDTMILTSGKRSPITITVTGLYTEGASDFYNLVQTAYEAGTAFYVRYSPRGDDSAELRFSTAAGVVKQPPYPGGSAASADPVICTLVLETTAITEETVAP